MNSLFSHLALFSFILICSVVTTPGPQQNGKGSLNSEEKLPNEKNVIQRLTEKLFPTPFNAKVTGQDSNDKVEKKSRNSLGNGMKKMLESGIHADILFSFGKDEEKKILPAHKCILNGSSNVFKTMFRFDEQKLADQRNEKVPRAKEQKMSMTVVEIPDIDADVFKTMLQFIYWEDLGGVNGNNLMKVFYAADKYEIIGLFEACIAFPLDKLTNIFLTYAQAHENGGKELADRCLAYIDQNAERLIHSNEFLEIDKELLIQILGRDQLVVKDELSIWNAALRWANFQCEQQSIECSEDNRTQVLGEALYNIRFPLIPQHHFNEIISLVELLDDDMVSVYTYYSNQQNSLSNDEWQRNSLKFSTKPRNYTKKRIAFIIDKFSEFKQSKKGSYRLSHAVNVSELEWTILAIHDEDGFFFGLQAGAIDDKERNLRRECEVTLRIIAQKEGKKDHIKELKKTFENEKAGYGCFVTFQQLEYNGWYNEEKDSVALVVDFIVIDPK